MARRWLSNRPAAAAVLVLFVTSVAIPRVYTLVRSFSDEKKRHTTQSDIDAERKKDHTTQSAIESEPDTPSIHDYHSPVPSFGVRSTVRTQAPPNSVQLPLRSTSDEFVSLSKLVQDNVPQVRNRTWSFMNPLLFNGHLQTMYASLKFDHIHKIYYGRRCLQWDDGSLVSADYMLSPPTSQTTWEQQLDYCPLDLDEKKFPRPERLRYLTPEEIKEQKNSPADKPLLVILHGLSGGSHESYVRCTIDEISKSKYGNEGKGFDCVVLNSRGCAGTPITTPQLFCAVWTDDIRRFIKLLRSEEDPNNRRRIYLAGFSLGASILANYLGQEGANTCKPETRVDGAVIVANPWDLLHSNQFLCDSFLGKYIYSPAMANGLNRLLNRHIDLLAKNIPAIYANPPTPKSIIGFDEAFTAPTFGFDSAGDYYRNGSSVNRIMSIRTPTLILNALDDPIVHKDCIPYIEAYKNPYLVLTTTSLGGHLGWFTTKGNGNRWFPEVIANFFSSFDQLVDHKTPVPEVTIVRPKRLLMGGI